MAKKRMLSVEFFSSDEFLNLQASVRLLYLHLNLMADDDGFVGNPFTVTKMLGVKRSLIGELCDIGYLISFPSGVVVIRHWHLHNSIKKDRYTPTRYREEYESLILDNDVYDLKTEDSEDEKSSYFGAVLDPQIKGSDPQDRLVERSEEKEREKKTILTESKEGERSARGTDVPHSEDYSSLIVEKEPTGGKSYTDTLSYEQKKLYNNFLNKIKLLFLGEYKSYDYDSFIKYNEKRRWFGTSGENVIENYKKYAKGWIEAGESFYE